MDVPGRNDREAGFTARLTAVFSGLRDRIFVDAPTNFGAFQEQLKSTLEDEIAAIYFLMMLQLTEWAESSPYISEPLPRGFSSSAADYASDRAETLAAEITSRLETEVNNIKRQFAPLEDIARQLSDHLDAALAEHRAKRIAVTEVTRATSFAEDEVRQRVERRAPVRLQFIWYTQDDERVCPVCGPLHMKGEIAWALRFPSGPPAHPNCRCYKQQSLVPAAVRVDTSDPNREGRRPSQFVGAGT